MAYPSLPILDDFFNHIHKLGDLSRIYSGDLYVLATFVMKQQTLLLGGHLLPDLIEFYNWLHSSFTLTIKDAATYKIGPFIKKFAERNLNKDFSKHLVDLYERVKQGCKKYLQSWGSNNSKALKNCNVIINDETTLLYLLSSKPWV